MKTFREVLSLVIVKYPISRLDVEAYQNGSISKKQLATLSEQVYSAIESEDGIEFGTFAPINTGFFDINRTYRLTPNFINIMHTYLNSYGNYYRIDDSEEISNFLTEHMDEYAFFFME